MVQGSGFAWLGTYYVEVAKDTNRAQKCFQRALSIDPLQKTAGVLTLHLAHLCGMTFSKAGFGNI